MVQAIPASEISLYDLETKFGVARVSSDQFFREWQDGLPELTNLEKQWLDRAKVNYLDLAKHPMLEDTVKMVVLSPLLNLADFYRLPFRITTETPVQIAAEDEGIMIQGRIDVLVLQNQLWVLVIESKRPAFSIDLAIPQILTYMLASPNSDQSSFGLITNGSQFIFLKLFQQDVPRYALSNVFSLLNQGNDLYIVLSILKQLRQQLT